MVLKFLKTPVRSESPGSIRSELAVILVPEIRDYVRINAEIINLLELGHTRIRLDGAEGQRLLAAGLSGSWTATIEVIGRSGAELAANLNAPGLKIIARGSTLDGAGQGLRAGLILIDGDAGDGLGYAQAGGSLLVNGTAGHRAGLGQSGGILALLGGVGRLAGDRQSGGLLFLDPGQAGPFLGRAQRGGRRINWSDSLDSDAQAAWLELVQQAAPWIESIRLARS